jgi:hypothetical protein
MHRLASEAQEATLRPAARLETHPYSSDRASSPDAKSEHFMLVLYRRVVNTEQSNLSTCSALP